VLLVARCWLDVPFADKDAARAAGARWDPAARRWYAPRPGMAALARWAARSELPALLPGEDRAYGSGLFVDPVPQTCWWAHARFCVSGQDWERVCRLVTGRAGQRCEACRRSADRAAGRWLETHERWQYDDPAATQILRRLVCLCIDCHQVTHFGLAQIRGRAGEALAHLAAVTGMTRSQADQHAAEAFALWRARSGRVWYLDLSILTRAGVAVIRPAGTASDRADRAAHGPGQAQAAARPRLDR
jgi:Domain of unknown function (DUF5710)